MSTQARPYSLAWWLAIVAISVASAALIVATEPAQANPTQQER